MDKLEIRFARKSDLRWLSKNDDIANSILKRKIEQREIIVSRYQDEIVGFLRVEFMWSKTPFISMIRVSKKYQRQGIGKSLLQFLEEYLARKGNDILLVSATGIEKEPQRWHRHMGFKECGYIDKIQKEGKEIFFYKKL